MMDGMASPGAVGLVSDDLMFASQLSTSMKQAGGSAVLVRGETIPDVAMVFVDLNTAVDARLDWISRIRAQHPDLEIVGFCHHGERAQRRRALASGATRVINNGTLREVALRLSGVSVEEAP
jgi:DNA-binding NarL/FixJ family response regulator